MKVTFFSNFMNYHQLPFALAMNKLTNGQFVFAATEPISAEHIKLGFKDMNHSYPFVLPVYDNIANEEKAMRLALESDVIITGSAPEKYTVERIKKGKLTFRYRERFLKQGLPPFYKLPRLAVSMWLHHGRYRNYPLYMLCAGAYTAYDFNQFGAYRNKCFRWGYFPEVKKQNLEELFAKKNSGKLLILWVGRLIAWKHPDAAILVADVLREKHIEFELNIIGNGEMEMQLQQMICDLKLEGCVRMLGAMGYEKVREYMERANLFLFTSDFNEGWGAVLNEAMSSGCAVIASHAIGAVPFLINNGENGLIYRSADQNDLNAKIFRLINEPEFMKKMGVAAYKTIYETWNADVAAERFLILSDYLQSGNKASPFFSGPCSKAPKLSNKQAEKLLYRQ